MVFIEQYNTQNPILSNTICFTNLSMTTGLTKHGNLISVSLDQNGALLSKYKRYQLNFFGIKVIDKLENRTKLKVVKRSFLKTNAYIMCISYRIYLLSNIISTCFAVVWKSVLLPTKCICLVGPITVNSIVKGIF